MNNKYGKYKFLIVFLGVMLVFWMLGDFSIIDGMVDKLLILPAILIGVSFHEAAHGFVSHKLGDPLPKMQGRLTLNPAAHIDIYGFLALLLVGFGWGKPVMIDPSYYKKPRRDEFLVAIAGVTTNFIIALIFAFLQVFLIYNEIVDMSGSGLGNAAMRITSYIIVINIVLMVFNLLPIPPLDGFSIVTQIFDLKKYPWYMRVYKQGFLILIFLVFIGFLDGFLGRSVNTIYNFIMNTVLSIF